MKKILIGMILIFLNFHITIGFSRIGLTPNFLGYFFILRGILELESYKRFLEMKLAAKIMMVYFVFDYVRVLLGAQLVVFPHVFLESSRFALLFRVSPRAIPFVIFLFILYNIIMGVREIELTEQRSLNSKYLYLSWIPVVIFSIVDVLTVFSPRFGVASTVSGTVFFILYLFMFNKTKSMFYNRPKTNESEFRYRIKTNRLEIRRFKKEDDECYIKMMTNPAVTKYLGDGKDKTEEDVRKWLSNVEIAWAENGFGVLAVVESESGDVIGFCGFSPTEEGREFLYAFDPSVWGRGYATEAGSAVLKYAKDKFNWPQIYAFANTENIASISVLIKLGFSNDGQGEEFVLKV